MDSTTAGTRTSHLVDAAPRSSPNGLARSLAPAIVTALGVAPAAYSEAVVYEFNGNGYVCTSLPSNSYECDYARAFTGTVTVIVLTAGPNGSDGYTDGVHQALDDNGWVQSDFDVQWDDKHFNPEPLSEPASAFGRATVYNDNADYPLFRPIDALSILEQYFTNDDRNCSRSARMTRSTLDTSWLSDLSFNLKVGLAPGEGATNEIVFDSRCDSSYFFGLIDLLSLSRRASVEIDIRPGSDHNHINPRSNGMIPVAVLGSTDFDATQMDSSTVTFGPHEASPLHDGRARDVNDDGFVDMRFQFAARASGIHCDDDSASLSGKTFAQEKFSGSDSLVTTPCR
jgi:hypothetical protein